MPVGIYGVGGYLTDINGHRQDHPTTTTATTPIAYPMDG
jgi:hypothetical protein